MLYFPLWLVFPVFVFGKAMQILAIFLCLETLVLRALTNFFYKNNFIGTRLKFGQKLRTNVGTIPRLRFGIINAKFSFLNIFLKHRLYRALKYSKVEIDRISIATYILFGLMVTS